MTTRLRITNVAAPYTPPTIQGAWNVTTQGGASLMSPTPQGVSVTVTQAVGTSNAPIDVVLRRFVSDPMTVAGALAGTTTWMIMVGESSITVNAMWKMHIYVTAGDTDTVRGTLLSNNIDTVEWATTAAGVGRSAIALSSVNCSVGDRIVAVCGWHTAGSTSASGSANLRYGGTGSTDLANGGTAAVNPGWIEFSDADALFVPVTPTGPAPGQFFPFLNYHSQERSGELWTPEKPALHMPRRRRLLSDVIPAQQVLVA